MANITAKDVKSNSKATKNFILVIISLIVFWGINTMSFGPDLDATGKFYLAATLMMLVIWFSHSLTVAVSSFLIMGVLCLTMPHFTGVTATAAYQAILSGYTTSTFPLLLSAFIMVACVNITGLGKRLGLMLISTVGPKPKRLVLGTLIAFPLLNLFIPSVQSVTLVMFAIMTSIVEDYKLDLKSNVAKSLFLAIAFAALPSTMYIQTAGAAAARLKDLVNNQFGNGFTYFEYFRNGLPLAIGLGTVAYFLITRMFKPEFNEFPGGKEHIQASMRNLPAWTLGEKKVAFVCSASLALWITGGYLHKIDTGVVALLAALILMMPKIGVVDYPQVSGKINWGILLLVGTSSSIATGMRSSGAAAWLVDQLLVKTSISRLPITLIVCGGLFIVGAAALAFATRASAVNAMMPCVMAFCIVVAELNGNSIDPRGLSQVLFYPFIFCCLLPVHSPFLLQTYASNTYEEKDFSRIAYIYVLSGIILCTVFFFTYWRWVGLV